MKMIAVATLVLLAACAKKADAPVADTVASKPLASTWDNTTWRFDIPATVVFGLNNPITFTHQTGDTCACVVLPTGTTASGTYVVSSCGFSGSKDPGCATLNETGSFGLANSVLTLCPNSGAVCRHYQ